MSGVIGGSSRNPEIKQPMTPLVAAESVTKLSRRDDGGKNLLYLSFLGSKGQVLAVARQSKLLTPNDDTTPDVTEAPPKDKRSTMEATKKQS